MFRCQQATRYIPEHIPFLWMDSFQKYGWNSAIQWLIVGLGWWCGFLESPYERDCYLGVPLALYIESQTTNPNQQLTMS